MSLKNWLNERREKKETQKRFEELDEDELQNLHQTEKAAYLYIAKKQVTYRGKINAYKDFPINDSDKINIEQEYKEKDSEKGDEGYSEKRDEGYSEKRDEGYSEKKNINNTEINNKINNEELDDNRIIPM